MKDINWFGLLIRILKGDTVWFVLGGLAALIGYGLGWLVSTWLRMPVWLRVIVGLLLAALAVLLVHEGFEAFWAWWRRPLAPPLQLEGVSL